MAIAKAAVVTSTTLFTIRQQEKRSQRGNNDSSK